MLPRYTPQVDAWGQLQASHPMEGPLYLRRNFNHNFLTLGSEWDNRLRHGCSAVLIRRIARDVLPLGGSTMHRAEPQLTGSQPQGGELSLADGNDLSLSKMSAKEVWPWNLRGYGFPVESVL